MFTDAAHTLCKIQSLRKAPLAPANGLSRSFNLIHSYHQPSVEPRKTKNTPITGGSPRDRAHLCRATGAGDMKCVKQKTEFLTYNTQTLNLWVFLPSFPIHGSGGGKKKPSRCAFINVAVQRRVRVLNMIGLLKYKDNGLNICGADGCKSPTLTPSLKAFSKIYMNVSLFLSSSLCLTRKMYELLCFTAAL